MKHLIYGGGEWTKATARPFAIIRHSTDSENRPIVDYCGTYISNSDAIKLRDDLNRLIPSPEHAALLVVVKNNHQIELLASIAVEYHGTSEGLKAAKKIQAIVTANRNSLAAVQGKESK